MRTIKAIFKFFLVLVLVCALASSCVYDYEPKDARVQGLGKPLVVIDGDIIVGGITNVAIGLTESLTGEMPEMPIGITVNVESESGDLVSGLLVDDVHNVFEVDTRELDIGTRYRLNIAIPGMGEYVSEFKRVMVSPSIDEITWSRSDDGTYINIEVTTHNMNTDKLYCKWNFYENWESNSVYTPFVEFNPLLGRGWLGVRNLTIEETLERKYCWSESTSEEICIANTEKLSKNIISKYVLRRIVPTDTRVSGLYSITVSQKALDKDAYIYWETLKRNTGGTGGIFSAQPTDLRGNIRCMTNPEEYVIGYISVSTRTEIRHFIDWEKQDFYNPGCSSFSLKNMNTDVWSTKYYEGYRMYAVDENTEWWSYHRCVDCRVYSNSTRPDFWPR